jgi:hypothetical protein
MLNAVKHLFANLHSSLIDPSLSLRMTKLLRQIPAGVNNTVNGSDHQLIIDLS